MGTVVNIPEDRHAYGMVESYSVADNMVLNTYYKAPFARGINVQPQAIRENAEALVKKFDVRTPSVEKAGGGLSGGNQQRW